MVSTFKSGRFKAFLPVNDFGDLGPTLVERRRRNQAFSQNEQKELKLDILKENIFFLILTPCSTADLMHTVLKNLLKALNILHKAGGVNVMKNIKKFFLFNFRVCFKRLRPFEHFLNVNLELSILNHKSLRIFYHFFCSLGM